MPDDILEFVKLFTAATAAFFAAGRLWQALSLTTTRQKTLSTEVLRDAKATFALDAKIDGFIKTVEKENTFRAIFGRAVSVDRVGPIMDLYLSGRFTIGQIRCILDYASVENGVLKVSLSFLEKIGAFLGYYLILIFVAVGLFALWFGTTFYAQYPFPATQALQAGLFSIGGGLIMGITTFDLLITYRLLRQKKLP